MRKIGVTGATGFLGSHLVQVLAERGFEVIGVARDPSRAAALTDRGIEVRKADLEDPDALARAFEGLDAVISNASLSVGGTTGDLAAFVDAERRGTGNVVDAALAAGVTRLVHVSSVSVYRLDRPNTRVAESQPRRSPTGRFDLARLVTKRGYADGKAAAEDVIWDAVGRGLRPTVLRPGPIYGARDPKLTSRWRRAMAARVQLVPTVGLPHVHAGDVAHAAAGALDNDASIGRAYNITGEPLSLLEVARAAREATGSSAWLIPVPVPLWLGWDNSAAERELGVRYRPIADGMREALGAGS